ncbi:FtsX-like permease family protein [Actinoallomurus bryophytorum]|uniref:Putative ABC transport system permease protein n=1 Tax=Actinoallomurus bryophytorum TaxID=1490222 RepID=A0A543CPV5_9ACTN|nr:FtsX-like permease family protein [Actinoallomurus bryophytorum]TQL99124.1 putative ABC transport system permease protein [Actinoallomurus bryophytorum]
MMRIAWRMLTQRPASMLATFLALWFAVGIVTTCGAMLESGIRFHGTTARYAAAPVLVATTDLRMTEGRGDDRDTESLPLLKRGSLDASLPGRIAAAPGVRAAVADIAVPAQVAAGGGTAPVEVHPWSAAPLAPFTLRTGAAPTGDDQVVLDEAFAARIGAKPGDQVRLGLASGPRAFTVGGIAAPTGTAPRTPTIFVGDAEARVLSGGATEVIGVLPEQGVGAGTLAASVRRALPPDPARLSGAYPRVYTGASRGSVESTDVGNGREFVIAVSGVFGGCALLIGVLVIAGTVGLSVRQRHRDIALLRALAATPRQVRRMVIREAAALGVLAGVAGIWPGLAGADRLREEYVSRGMVPDSFRTHLSWLPPLVATGAALLIAVVAAWAASLRASRIQPTEALAETTVERGGLGIVRAVLGLVALAGGITLCFVSASVSGDSAAGTSVATVFTLVVSVALLSPLLIRAAAATFGRLLRLAGVTGRLAAANTAASARRLSAVVSSLVLAVALGGSLWFVQTSELHVAAGQSRAGLVADHVVTSAGPGLRPDVTEAIRRTAGVSAATRVVHSTIFTPRLGLTDFSAQGVDAAGLARTMNLGVTSGALAGLSGDTVAVDTLTAQALHLRVGGRFTGWFGDGAPVNLRVVAIYRRGLGFAQLTVPHDLLLPHTTSGLDDAVLVATDRAQAVTAVRAELDRLAPGSALLARDAYQVGLGKDMVANAWTNQMVVGVLLIYVVIAAVNTLAMYALGRRREFAVLRLSGTTRPQVLSMVRLEQVLLLGLALVVGAAIAAATLIPMVKGITGSPTPYIPLAGWVAVIGGVVLLGGAATAVPVRRVLRTRPVEGIGLRE